MDYSNNNSHYKHYYGNSYQVIDVSSCTTTANDKSPIVNGKRKLKENQIYREWSKHRGIPLYAAVHSYNPNGSLSVSLWSKSVYGNTFPNSTILSELKAQALNDALDKFHSQVSNRHILMMEYILERAGTQRSIIEAFKAIINLRKNLTFKRIFKTLKFYNPRTKKIELKRVELSIAEKWLAYSFFWKPLMQDLYSIMKGFEPLKSSPVRVRGYVEKQTTESYSDNDSSQMRLSSYKVRCAVVGSVIIEDPLIAVLDELGLADPAQIAWNALPFSFVVDWFVNIGSILDQMSSPGKALYGTSVTYLTQFIASSSGHVTNMTKPKNGYISNLGTGIQSENIVYQRVPGPLPRPRLQLLGGINSGWRIFTAAALLKVLGSSKL